MHITHPSRVNFNSRPSYLTAKAQHLVDAMRLIDDVAGPTFEFAGITSRDGFQPTHSLIHEIWLEGRDADRAFFGLPC